MKINLFSSLLVTLILTLFMKASIVFKRIEEQTSYSMNMNTSSIVFNTSYASPPPAKKEPNPTENNDELYGAKIVDNIKIKSNKIKSVNPLKDLSRSEITLLKKLSTRRDQLEKQQENIDLREKILQATEKKIDQKISELKLLQTQLENLLKLYDKKENSKIMSLVKIYETMKPKDAAKIFNDLEMPVLIRLASNMKEIKLASILASMNTVQARELSIELAKQKPIE